MTRFIYEVMKANQKLMKQNELLKSTFLSLRDGVISVDLDGKVTMMNTLAEKMSTEGNLKILLPAGSGAARLAHDEHFG